MQPVHKSTRDELFRQSIDYFMNSGKYDGIEYSLNCKTKNVRKNEQKYDILFPKTKQIGIIDYSGGNEPIIMDQELPMNTTFITDLKTYFEPYIKYENNKMIIGTYVLNKNVLENDVVSKIQVCIQYTNKLEYQMYQPYYTLLLPPTNNVNNEITQLQQTLDELKKENQELKNTIKMKEDLYDQQNELLDMVDTELGNKCRRYKFLDMMFQNYKICTQNNNKRIVSNFKKIYEMNNIQEECPICYETMNCNTVIMPVCGHSICNDCIKKCNSTCPICREEYHQFDKLYLDK